MSRRFIYMLPLAVLIALAAGSALSEAISLNTFEWSGCRFAPSGYAGDQPKVQLPQTTSGVTLVLGIDQSNYDPAAEFRGLTEPEEPGTREFSLRANQ